MFEALPPPPDGVTLSSSIWLTLGLLVLYKIWDWYRQFRNWRTPFNKLPGDGSEHWLWGNIHLHPGPGEDGIEFQHSWMKKYPKLHTVWASNFRCFVITYHPDVVRELLRAPAYLAPKPRDVGSIYVIGIEWLGEGLLIANGNRWSRNRRLLTPAFHFDILQPYVQVVNDCVEILLDKIQRFADADESFEVFQHIGLCSLDIILKCAFSYDTECQTQGDKHPYVQAVHRLSECWVDRSMNPAQYPDFIYFNFTRNGREFLRLCHFVHKIAEDIINKRRKTLEAEGEPVMSEDKKKRHLDFLDIILTARDDTGAGLSDLEIRNEVDTFLFEGHDTTTSGISFILQSLAEHPDIQEKCRQEVCGILGDRERLEWKDLSKMEYLTQCIKEGLRLHSPVYFIQRQITEEMVLDGYKVPKDTAVAINIHNLHHNEIIWGPDHNDFKPERFSPDKVAEMDPFAFLPFSAGPRNCIGQNFAMNEIKVMVARLIKRFRLTLKPGHVVKKRMGVVMRTEDGIWMNAEPIKS